MTALWAWADAHPWLASLGAFGVAVGYSLLWGYLAKRRYPNWKETVNEGILEENDAHTRS